MKIKDIVQTVILICCLVMIPVFGLAYYLYAQADLDFSILLDKSFGVMVGVFSGAATLSAAYIASLLFNDWREQANFDRASKLHDKAVDVLTESAKELNKISGYLRSHNIKTIANLNETHMDELCDIITSTFIRAQEITHNASIQMSFDYSRLLNKDNDLKLIFSHIISIKNFIQNIMNDCSSSNKSFGVEQIIQICEFSNLLNRNLDSLLIKRNISS